LSLHDARPIWFEAGLEALGETAETWNGMVYDDDGNQGRFDLLAAASAGRSIGGGVEAFVGVKVPIVTHVVGGQLEYPVVLEVGLSRAFELGGHHEEEGGHGHGHGAGGRGHDHGGEPAGAAGADIADLTTTGEAVALAPVAGKVTVFDFWAPWCAPCIELDAALRELAARHPGRLAIRRINVVD